jgi:hypothetical protein
MTESKARSLAVFISHSSADSRLAEALVELLRRALRLSASDIRCTSIDGGRLPAGAETADVLRREIAAARAFICLVTPAGARSSYVLFELGARWGMDRHIAPVVARGFDIANLPGPLAAINALNISHRAQVQQLLEDLRIVVDGSLEPASSLTRGIEAVVEAACEPSHDAQPAQDVDTGWDDDEPSWPEDGLSDQEVEILKMFVELRDQHTAEDVAKRFPMNRHKADYHLDQLATRRLIAHLSDYRNGRPVYFITREGKAALVRLEQL